MFSIQRCTRLHTIFPLSLIRTATVNCGRPLSVGHNLNKSTKSIDKVESKPNVNNDFKEIYRYPKINTSGIFVRSKIYSFLSNLISIPAVYILEINGHVEPNSYLAMAYIGCSLTIACTGAGLMSNNLIGIMYYNDKTDMLRIAYINFFGKRVDHYVLRSDLSPLKKYRFYPFIKIIKNNKDNISYKIDTNIGILNSFVFNVIFNSDEQETKVRSNVDKTKDSESEVNKSEEIDINELLKKVQEENEKEKK